jgi:general secretion pathway protein M
MKLPINQFTDALPLLAALRSETGSRISTLNVSGAAHNGLVQLTALVERQ